MMITTESIEVRLIKLAKDNKTIEFFGETESFEKVIISLTKDEIQCAYELLNEMD